MKWPIPLVLGAVGLAIAACAPNLGPCSIGCTNGTTLIHLSPELIATKNQDLIKFVVAHELAHILLEHKPWMGAKELEADAFAFSMTAPLGVSPCPAARLLRDFGETGRANAIGVENSCRGF